MFAACTKRELSRIAALSDVIEAPEGKVLTRQGDTGWEFFVIVNGKAKASIRGRPSATLGPGSFFGEMALLDHGPRTATVTAETDMDLLVLNARDFSGLLIEAPTVARRMLEVLAERLREAERAQPQH